MIYFKVILICFASLSAVQAIDSCSPKYYFSIDKYGFPNCNSDCAATVVFSGLRTGNKQFLTIDMIADHYEPNDYMTLKVVTDKDHNLNCTTGLNVFRNKDANGLHCSWKISLDGSQKSQMTNRTMFPVLVYDSKAKARIYFGFNGHQSPVASSLSGLVQYNDLFPDCTEYDVLTFYDPKRLNKITLSKQKDSITVFVHSLNNNEKGVDRTVTFTNSGRDQFNFECNGDFQTGTRYVTRTGFGKDWRTNDLSWTSFTGIPFLGKCAWTLPLKIKGYEYEWEFDFTKKPLNMIFTTTQPGASFTQRNIKFKYD